MCQGRDLHLMPILTRNKKMILILKAAIKFFKILDVHVYVYIYMHVLLEGNLVRYSREAKKKKNQIVKF